MVDAFRAGGGDGKPMFLQAALCYHPDAERALHEAHARWPIAALTQDILQNAQTPEAIAARTAGSTPADLKGTFRASADLGQHVAWLQGDRALGLDSVFLHHVGAETERFIDVFGAKVLPALGA